MQYQVPQFIEVEDKVVGPLTIKQFLYITGGAAIMFLLWSFLPRSLAIIASIPVAALFGMLAFYKYNGKPFVVVAENAMKYLFGPKLYVWRKEQRDPKKGDRPSEQAIMDAVNVPKLSESKLRELTWSLDINDTMDSWQKK